jgi:hypothetical protein
MTEEKFKYGPLIWNCVGRDVEDDENNYYWPGSPPVAYDEMGLPVDKDGRQCLPLDCPFHPHHSFKDFITSKYGATFPASFKDYEDWLDKNFIVFDKATVKRNIVTKIITQVVGKTDAANVYKAVHLTIKEVETHYGESFTKKKVD